MTLLEAGIPANRLRGECGKDVNGVAGVVRERLLKWKAQVAVVGTKEDAGVDTARPTFSAKIEFGAMRLRYVIMSLGSRRLLVAPRDL